MHCEMTFKLCTE